MLGYSPQMDWRAVVEAGVFQGAGLGILMPALTKAAFSTRRENEITILEQRFAEKVSLSSQDLHCRP
jgi:hypothetical protein